MVTQYSSCCVFAATTVAGCSKPGAAALPDCQTAPVAYHVDLWVATAAAAPVIALAGVLSASDWVGGIRQLGRSAHTSLPARDQIMRTANQQKWLIIANLALQIWMLYIALFSLATTQDRSPAAIPVIVEPTGILLLVGTSLLNARIRALLVTGKYSQDQHGPSEPNSD